MLYEWQSVRTLIRLLLSQSALFAQTYLSQHLEFYGNPFSTWSLFSRQIYLDNGTLKKRSPVWVKVLWTLKLFATV